MSRPPESKLPDIGTTIFTTMSKLATDCGAINLSQGFPSFEPPPELLQRVTWHLQNGANQYPPMPGVESLRQAIAAKVARLQGRLVCADTEVTVCSGATEGLFASIQALVHPGDEVIILDPAFDSYEPAIRLAGGLTRHVPLAIENGEFSVDWQRLQDAINDKTRLLVLNFPHNPTGATLSRTDLQTLADILQESSAYILSDEVYEHIVFDGRRHHSLCTHEQLWERTIVVSSFGKTYHATGWKVGYCVAPAALTQEFRKVHQFTTFTVSSPMQFALADFMHSQPDYCDKLPAFYQQKRDLFCARLQGSRFTLQPARSTFFQILDYGAISDESDVALAKRWTREIGIASIPLSVFCETDFTGTRLRFCFAKDDETLERAADVLSGL
ncbi:MAG: methionine aminotransferase [Woeseiaceae bacterium]